MSLCKTTSSYICIVKDSIRYSFKKFMRLYYLFVYACVLHVWAHQEKPKNNLWESVLSFFHVRPGAGTQVGLAVGAFTRWVSHLVGLPRTVFEGNSPKPQNIPNCRFTKKLFEWVFSWILGIWNLNISCIQLYIFGWQKIEWILIFLIYNLTAASSPSSLCPSSSWYFVSQGWPQTFNPLASASWMQGCTGLCQYAEVGNF